MDSSSLFCCCIVSERDRQLQLRQKQSRNSYICQLNIVMQILCWEITEVCIGTWNLLQILLQLLSFSCDCC